MEERLLFRPGRIGTMKLKNRILMTPLHMAFSMEQEVAFLAERAAGGAASVTAVMGISADACHRSMCHISHDTLPHLRRLAALCAEQDCRSLVQLFHVGRNCREGELADPRARPVAPSPVPSLIYKSVPREMTVEDMQRVVRSFGEAARLCRETGIDGVEVNCSAGYLLTEFLSPHTNLRQDAYGGSEENRMRFPLEVLRSVREAVGPDYPVLLRLSGDSMVEGGYALGDMERFSAAAAPFLDALSVTGGWHESPVPQISREMEPGSFSCLALAIGAASGLPAVACNRINTGELAEEILRRGDGDFVGCARAFVVEPHFAEKVRRGEPVSLCAACNRCVRAILRGREAVCPRNPQLGREYVKAEGREPSGVRGPETEAFGPF